MSKHPKYQTSALFFANLLVLGVLSLAFTGCGEPLCNGLVECIKGEWVQIPSGDANDGFVLTFYNDEHTLGIKPGDNEFIIPTGQYSWVSDKTLKIDLGINVSMSTSIIGLGTSQLAVIDDVTLQDNKLILTKVSNGDRTVFQRNTTLEITNQNIAGSWHEGWPRTNNCFGLNSNSSNITNLSIDLDGKFEIEYKQISMGFATPYKRVKGLYKLQNDEFIVQNSTNTILNPTPTIDLAQFKTPNLGNVEGPIVTRAVTPTPEPTFTPTPLPTATPIIASDMILTKCQISAVSQYRLEISDDQGHKTVFIRNPK